MPSTSPRSCFLCVSLMLVIAVGGCGEPGTDPDPDVDPVRDPNSRGTDPVAPERPPLDIAFARIHEREGHSLDLIEPVLMRIETDLKEERSFFVLAAPLSHEDPQPYSLQIIDSGDPHMLISNGAMMIVGTRPKGGGSRANTYGVGTILLVVSDDVDDAVYFVRGKVGAHAYHRGDRDVKVDFSGDLPCKVGRLRVDQEGVGVWDGPRPINPDPEHPERQIFMQMMFLANQADILPDDFNFPDDACPP